MWREHAKRAPEQPRVVERADTVEPRLYLLDALMTEVEGFVPSDFSDLEEARRLLRAAGFTANNLFTRAVDEQREREALAMMQDERGAFVRYITAVTVEELAQVEPLPHARVLTRKESARIWQQLEERWGIEGRRRYWYPLTDAPREEVEAFDVSLLALRPGLELLHRLLIAGGGKRIYELPEMGAERELALQPDIPLFHREVEIYWTDDRLDWVVYISHKNTIAISGWLLEELKRAWPLWRALVWTPSE